MLKIRSLYKIFFLFISILGIAPFSFSQTKSEVEQALSFLYSNMSSADQLSYSEDFWRTNVEKTFEIKNRMKWNIPEREFKYFVLPIRANNETLDNFRILYADTLCKRVEGMSMYDAVLEINHWCLENATYAPSDARTSSPIATIRNRFGRCGEESVLTVAALRAVGIPARQVYTPRWAHTDDNHAWVEAYVDGKWYFLGACEPEAKLNMAWFNGPVSRAMILHTKVFGQNYDGPEEVLNRTKAYTEINVTPNYVSTHKLKVKVVDENLVPVVGAIVNFTVYNYAEFYTVASYTTDNDGIAQLIIGNGDMLLFAYKGNKFGVDIASFPQQANDQYLREQNVVVKLDREIGERFCIDYQINPPIDNPIPSDATEEEILANKRRVDKENQIRESSPRGNGQVLDKFKASLTTPKSKELADAILKNIAPKDLNDVTLDVLEDALNHSAKYGDEFSYYRDCPRIEREFLKPYFSLFAQMYSSENFTSPQEIVKWVGENIKIDSESNPQNLRIAPCDVARAKVADRRSRNIFFVALCRSMGFPARIDPVTSKTQYLWGNEWVDVAFLGESSQSFIAPKGSLKLDYSLQSDITDPIYYKHFSISSVSPAGNTVLSFNEDSELSYSKVFSKETILSEGYYLLTSGARQSNGGVLAHLEFFQIEKDKQTAIPLVIKQITDQLSILGRIDPEEKFLPHGAKQQSSIVSAVKEGYYLIAVVGDKDEPTTHAIRQISAIQNELNSFGLPIIVLGKARPSGIQNLIVGKDLDNKIFRMLSKSVSKESSIIPLVAICDSSGRVLYYSQGYNTSLGEEVKRALKQL